MGEKVFGKHNIEEGIKVASMGSTLYVSRSVGKAYADLERSAVLTGKIAIKRISPMVPMIHSGCGLNFGLPLGIIAGLLGATLSLEAEIHGFAGFLMAIVFATPFALVLGWGYGKLLNKVKGGEMMIATYVGFSSVSFMPFR